MSNHRQHPRFDVTLEALLEVDGSGERHTVSLNNLSLGGAHISFSRLDIGTSTTLHLNWSEGQLALPATVRWADESGFGIQFGSLRAKDMWTLQRIIRHYEK